MRLDKLESLKGKTNKSKRRGRGIASGKGGHVVGFGMKGQKSRTGNSIPVGFEGGQVPLFKKLPKWGGFKSTNRFDVVEVTLSFLEKNFKANETVTINKLFKLGLAKKSQKAKFKILGTGKLTKKLKVKNIPATKTATEKIQELGGSVE